MSFPFESKIDGLEWAFEMQSMWQGEDAQTYISKTTGAIVCDAEMMTGEPCEVDNVQNNDDYIPVPDKFDLDLGQPLVWRFVEIEIPGLEQKIREIFSRRAAYRRWKDFLDRNHLLDKWHCFEEETTRKALLDWCQNNGVSIKDSPEEKSSD